MDIKQTISEFDTFLSKQGLSLEAVAIGGAALALLGVISRHTRDCDILDPLLPPDIRRASTEFAMALRQAGEVVDDNWFNHEPHSLSQLLPKGWKQRTQMAFKGKALVLHTFGRSDFVCTKLFALCDRGTDLADCIALRPSVEEIEEALPWVNLQDAHQDWPRHVKSVLADLSKRLGHGI